MRTSRVIGAVTSAVLAAATVAGATTTASAGAAPKPSSACVSWQLAPTPAWPDHGAALGSVSALGGRVVVTGVTTLDQGTALNGAATWGLPGYAVGRPWVLHGTARAISSATQVPLGARSGGDPARPSAAANAGADQVGWVSTFDSPSDGWTFPSASLRATELNEAIAERWHDGHWELTALEPTMQALIEVEGVPMSEMVRDVAALSPRDAWVVGALGWGNQAYGQHFGITDKVTIEHWDGRQWHLVPGPETDLPGAVLYSLAPVSPTDIWAVGVQYVPGDDSSNRPLVEHWDGESWSVVPAPAGAGDGGSSLRAVSVIDGDDVWAVGQQHGMANDVSHSTPLVEHWDGESWTVQTAPDIEHGLLASVYAAAPGDVWAVAYQPSPFEGGQAEHQSAFLHWDGSTWTEVPVPGPKEYGVVHQYMDIAGSGPGDVWAVGTAYDNGNLATEPLIAHLSCGEGGR